VATLEFVLFILPYCIKFC